jgi:hypothetical protein
VTTHPTEPLFRLRSSSDVFYLYIPQVNPILQCFIWAEDIAALARLTLRRKGSAETLGLLFGELDATLLLISQHATVDECRELAHALAQLFIAAASWSKDRSGAESDLVQCKVGYLPWLCPFLFTHRSLGSPPYFIRENYHLHRAIVAGQSCAANVHGRVSPSDSSVKP